MAEIALSLGGSMLGATVQVVLEKFASHAIREVGGFLKFNEDLGRMKDSLEMIKAYLVDAERKAEFEEDRVIKVWIAKVRRANYEADDLLDELQYHWLRHEVEGHTQVRKRLSSLKTKYKYSHKVQKIQETLDGILASAVNYNFRQMTVLVRGNLMAADEITQERVTTSLMSDEEMIGRDDKKTEVIEQLVSKHEGVQVLTVYGIGGVGKTTLARYVYNDEVIQKHFKLKIWVCVSDNFDVKRLTSEILDSVLIQSKKSNIRRSSEYRSLDELQKALREELTGNKFLLVLDDVWNKEQHKWDDFKKPFVTAGGISKSMILVTTRLIEIVKMMSSMKSIELEGLSPDDFWDLFKRYTFDGSNSGSNDETLEKIGREIVEKLKGSPLAAKTVGRLLKADISVHHWNSILNSELWKLSEGKDDIMPALRLSYQHLPGALKPCFAFLSLFPKDYKYRESMLKELWIANGFVFSQGSKSLEDTTTTYINTLLSMFMIQVVKHEEDMLEPFDLSVRRFVVHDLLHDLAQIISKDEYFRIRGDADLKNIPNNVRHLNISSEIKSSKLNNFKGTFKSLRTLVSDENLFFLQNSSDEIFIEAKHLRALMMSAFMSVREPVSKCRFKHLRYLDLSNTDISCLPESLCTFYNLQVLNVKECRQLNKFPVGILKLANLRHIYTSGAEVSTSSIKNVGKLTSLQELCFHVSKGVGHTLAELENMNDIRELEIEHLENVSSKEEAIHAGLNDKKHLVSLTLKWSSEITGNIPYDEILCGLQPYKYLRILEIYNYGGAEFPPWEENENGSLPTLQKFVLKNCLKLHTLKSLEHPELQHLEIRGCPKLKKISLCRVSKLWWLEMSSCEELSLGSGFEGLDSLKYLKTFNCDALWDDMVMKTWILPSSLQELNIKVGPSPPLFTHDELVAFMSKSLVNLSSLRRLGIEGLPHITKFNGEALQHMTSLKQLYISNWMELESLDIRTLTSLGQLIISGCNKIKSSSGSILPPSLEWFSISNFEMVESMPDFGLPPSLLYLMFDVCSNLEFLPKNLNHLPSLCILTFEGCSNLEFLPENLNHLTSLEILQIKNCPKIKSLPANGLPPSLRRLELIDCSNLESLPENLNRLLYLEMLQIQNCPKFKSLPANGLPPSLETLWVQDCPKIKSSPANGLPPSLRILVIYECPLLKTYCLKDMKRLSNIHRVVIDGMFLQHT